MVFLKDGVPEKVRDKNRRGVMQFFLELTKRNVPSVQETLIMAYGQAARYVERCHIQNNDLLLTQSQDL